MRTIICVFCIMLLGAVPAGAQDNRTQYPKLLSNAYFSMNLGYIHYPFTNAHMEDGYTAEKIQVPHLAVRLILLGYRFNPYLSAQLSYMRPVKWVEYVNINGDGAARSVYMNVGGLTLKSQLPLGKKLSLAGEAGLGIVTRNGFEKDEAPVVRDASYATLLMGAGLEFRLNKKWDLLTGFTYAPGSDQNRQPHTMYFSGGFRYNMNPLSPEKVAANASAGYFFPKHLLQVGYTTHALGYGVNRFAAKDLRIFWEGDAVVEQGLTLRYQRNIFHTRKVFAFDVGTSASWWKSEGGDHFFTASVFPLLRFTAMRTKPLDLYLFHSVAGPTYISKVIVDGQNTGKHFTFQDFMGLGVFAGKDRKLNAEVNINHYSNGNIFPDNAGVKIPLTFMVGYTF